MRHLIAAALLAVALPGAAAAEPPVPDPGSSVETLLPEVLDLRLAESVIPLEEEERAGARTTIRISSDVLFEFDSATLTPEAKTHLVRLAGRLKDREAKVEGFTDSLGAPAYNRVLSQRRADAVKAELVRLGVTGVTAKGYGEARPVAPNEIGGKDNPDGRAENRRVELVFGS
ncbi:OmpA family protein [Actinocorallia aurantiaca]|uniref:OmpA-like domain-containing protein n=1 Tax=Actinocorallia aurantiaca TaxID=46204 RepID=A0ABP6GBI8_9ACTN